MESLVRPIRREHGDRHGAQMVVESVAHRVGRRLPVEVEMGDLAERVDAGVGAPGAEHRRRLAREVPDRLLDRLLDRGAVLLALPADEGAAVVFEDEPVARHGPPHAGSGSVAPAGMA